jgi:hypothetical protein
VIVIGNVATTGGQPPEVGSVYDTVYAPGVLVLGVIAPVVVLIVNPAGVTLYVPVVYNPVPVSVGV